MCIEMYLLAAKRPAKICIMWPRYIIEQYVHITTLKIAKRPISGYFIAQWRHMRVYSEAVKRTAGALNLQ